MVRPTLGVMETAYVMTEELAAEHGIVGYGPHALIGIPGVWIVDEPVALSELGGISEEAMDDLLEAAGDVPLAKTDVEAGEGKAFRVNHWTAEDRVDEAEEAAGVGPAIRTHAEADAVAAELGIDFPEDAKLTVAEKVAAIETGGEG